MTALDSTVAYHGQTSAVSWKGRLVNDPGRFTAYLRGVVRPRIADSESGFTMAMRGLASTGMATPFLERVLTAVPRPDSSEVGEALAECVLRDDSGYSICWPWNMVRDRRTPRASLPGADLVGFCSDDQTALLLLGEVKTSSDASAPPRVMTGGGGMAWQLAENATRLDIHHKLLAWLHSRCQDQPYRRFYEQAVARYLSSEGRDLLVVGVLIRDTEPNELDLRSSGQALSLKLADPTRVDLMAWYLPVQISRWPALLEEQAP